MHPNTPRDDDAAFYEARKAIDKLNLPGDPLDNSPAYSPEPEGFPPDLDKEGRLQPLFDRALAVASALRLAFSGEIVAPPERVAMSIVTLRALWGELILADVQIDPAWEAWLAEYQRTGTPPPLGPTGDADGE